MVVGRQATAAGRWCWSGRTASSARRCTSRVAGTCSRSCRASRPDSCRSATSSRRSGTRTAQVSTARPPAISRSLVLSHHIDLHRYRSCSTQLHTYFTKSFIVSSLFRFLKYFFWVVFSLLCIAINFDFILCNAICCYVLQLECLQCCDAVG